MNSVLSRKFCARGAAQWKRGMAFARITSFKVKSVEEGQAVDNSVQNATLPAIKKHFSGFAGAERYLCGAELDYKLVTKWESVDNLKSFVAGDSDIIEELTKEFDIKMDTVHNQNFMHHNF